MKPIVELVKELNYLLGHKMFDTRSSKKGRTIAFNVNFPNIVFDSLAIKSYIDNQKEYIKEAKIMEAKDKIREEIEARILSVITLEEFKIITNFYGDF
jgi:SAM-dependent MidA family methyltransferase